MRITFFSQVFADVLTADMQMSCFAEKDSVQVLSLENVKDWFS